MGKAFSIVGWSPGNCRCLMAFRHGREKLAIYALSRQQVCRCSILDAQGAFAGAPVSPSGIEVSRRLTSEVLSLPMHPYLEELVQARVVEEVKGALLKRAR